MAKDEQRLSLTARILFAMVCGLICGLTLKYILPSSSFVQSYIIDGVLHFIGKIFIDSLKMLVVPLVFVSLVCGTCSLSDTTKLGRLGIKAVSLYLITTAIAVTLALLLSVLVAPGEGSNLQAAEYIPRETPALKDVLYNLFPSNPFRAMTTLPFL